MSVPVTRYAKSGDVHIAYQVFGSGTTDLVFVPGFISHIEMPALRATVDFGQLIRSAPFAT
jgi:hypothetical protein